MKRHLFCVVIAAILFSALPSEAQIRGFRQEQLKEWEFSKDGSNWETVAVPHSYNAEDGHSPYYYRGKATYRCDLRITDVKKTYYLFFEGAAQAAVVKVNGEQVAGPQGWLHAFLRKHHRVFGPGVSTGWR